MSNTKKMVWTFLGFAKDNKATTSLVFSLSVIPMLLVAGAAMDLSRAIREKTELQAATDSAALAAGRIMKTATSAELTNVATGHLTAGQGNPNYSITSGPTVSADKKEVCIETTTHMPTAVMKIAHVN